MQAPRTLLGRTLSVRWIADSLKRRLVLGAFAVLFAVLTFFPRNYHATVQIIEPMQNAAGLSSVLGQLGGNYAALLSTGQTYEINLAVGRTYVVERDVVKQMGLLGTSGYETLDTAVRRLRRYVTVRSMRGGIIAIETEHRNPAFALRLDAAYARVYSQRLSELARQQTAYKRGVLNARMQEAVDRLTKAQAALDQFRQRYRLPDPEAQIGSSVGQLGSLQASLQAKRVELQSALQFATPQNMRVRSLQAEIGSLQSQIREEQERQNSPGGMTAAGLAHLSNQYENLQRDVTFAQTLYQAYARYLEGSAVEEMSAAWNLQQLEPPYIRPGHQINKLPLAMLLLVLLIAAAAEIYLIFPPHGVRRIRTAAIA